MGWFTVSMVYELCIALVITRRVCRGLKSYPDIDRNECTLRKCRVYLFSWLSCRVFSVRSCAVCSCGSIRDMWVGRNGYAQQSESLEKKLCVNCEAYPIMLRVSSAVVVNPVCVVWWLCVLNQTRLHFCSCYSLYLLFSLISPSSGSEQGSCCQGIRIEGPQLLWDW